MLAKSGRAASLAVSRSRVRMLSIMGQPKRRSARPKRKLKAAATRTYLPAPYQRLLLQIACEQGASAAQVLAGTGLSAETLNAPDARVLSWQAARMVQNAIAATGNEGIGFECGLRAQPTLHGFLGYATMSCANLREALELAIRFIHLRERDVVLALKVAGDTAVLETQETHALGPVRHVFYEGMLTGLARVGGAVLGEDMLDCEIWFDWPAPRYYAAYRGRLPKIRFDMPVIQLRFSARELERRPLMADPAAAQLAIAQIEREQALIGRAPEQLLPRLRAELVPGLQGYPDLASVAAKLYMSTRTLKRKLQECGTSFQQLLDEARHRDALRLLANPDLEIQDIAAKLGYSDPPSFTRAFQRWTGGRLPSAARNR